MLQSPSYHVPSNGRFSLQNPNGSHQAHPNSSNLSEKEALQKADKYLWIDLSAELRKNKGLRSLFKRHIDLLNVSKESIYKFKHISPTIKTFLQEYGNQNCIRAISLIEDLTNVKSNQYKFMFEGLTLLRAVDILIDESSKLHKSLAKQGTPGKHFFRLVFTWIDYVFYIHKVPMDAQHELKRQIILQIRIVNNLTHDSHQSSGHSVSE
jgi:hypothetical protein